MSIVLKVKSYYRSRLGNIHGPLLRDDFGRFYSAEDPGPRWFLNGRLSDSGETEHDLVEEYTCPFAVQYGMAHHEVGWDGNDSVAVVDENFEVVSREEDSKDTTGTYLVAVVYENSDAWNLLAITGHLPLRPPKNSP